MSLETSTCTLIIYLEFLCLTDILHSPLSVKGRVIALAFFILSTQNKKDIINTKLHAKKFLELLWNLQEIGSCDFGICTTAKHLKN